MTTTVKRGAGRPAAAASTNRHAQRTPLPPKPGSPGAEAIAEAKAAKALPPQSAAVEQEAQRQYAQHGDAKVAELRKVAKELGVEGYSRMPRTALLNSILDAYRAKAATAERLAGRDLAAEVFQTAAKVRETSKRTGKTVGAAPVAPNKIDKPKQSEVPPTAAAASQTKSWQKAAAFRGSVEALGWACSVEWAPDGEPDDVVEATAQRGDEHLWISWTAGAMTLQPMPTYTISDRTIRLKNASACLKYAGRPVADAVEELSKVTSNKAFRRKTVTPKKTRIPFDTGLASDEEVIAALLGRTVEWHNSISQATETATLGRDAHRVKIQSVDGGDRIVKFCCPSTGFRAFRLSSLTRVGGSSKSVRTSDREDAE